LRKKNVFRVLRELKKRISEEQFDIIHCHGSRANLMGALLLRSMQIPVVSTIHSDYRLDYLGRPFGRLFYGTTNAIALRKLDYYIGVSDAMVDLLIRRKFPPDRLFAIYNGLDFSRPPRKADPETCRKSFGLEAEAGAVIVGIAARLSPVKDVGTLIRAFARAVARCPRLRRLIAGDGPELEKLKALAKRLGVSERVCFAGWVPDMDLFYQAIHINALTSLSETFPYALTEGARMSLPTVGSNVGGIPYLIEDGVTGFLFPPGDDALLAERLVALAEDEALRRKLGENLYEKASRDFSVKRTGRRQIEIYETILRRSRRPAGRDGVIICGAYGRGNAGDESILEAILKQLRRIDPDLPIWVMSRRPEENPPALPGQRRFIRFPFCGGFPSCPARASISTAAAA
jgi:glycosyltransferase involved in cell wall biosynthesis